MVQWERMTHFSTAARARFEAVHVLFKGMWARPLRWGCVNKQIAPGWFLTSPFPLQPSMHVCRILVSLLQRAEEGALILSILTAAALHLPPSRDTVTCLSCNTKCCQCAKPRDAAGGPSRAVSCMQGTLQGAPGASPKELSTQELSIPHKGVVDEDMKGINTALLIAKIIF